jgi:hypothetical protein
VWAAKGKRRVPKLGAGNRAAEPDIRVFSAEFALSALETGDFMTISCPLDAAHAGSRWNLSRCPCWKSRQEPLMRTTKDEAAAEGTLTRKEMQARDGAAAMAEYQAARKALVDNTAKLRAARLAREAAEAEARKAPPAKKVRVASRQK